MPSSLKSILLAFIPIFIAIDPIGLVPVFLSVTHGLPFEKRKKIAFQATGTAAVVALGFVVMGRIVFETLGITVADFQIAGGLILFVLAAREILRSGETTLALQDDVGAVPLGMPLIAGPALISTILLLMDTIGSAPTLVALFANLVLVALAFRFASSIERLVGTSRLKAASKIVALLLAAIAVSMIRRGLKSP